MTSPKINVEQLHKSHWSEESKKNASLVLEFVQLMMNDHNFEEIARRYKGKTYRQHNRNMEDGIEGVLKSLKDLVKNAPEFSYDVKSVFVDGDHVVLHAHATLKAKHRGDDTQGFNIMDTWKVENGSLIEHWDAVQGISLSMRMYALATGGKVRNSNGIF